LSREIGFHPEARAELAHAMEFYEAQAVGLGAEMVGEVEAAVESISVMPKAVAQELAGVRRKVLRRFPFIVVYEVLPEQVTVLAVMHQRQKPGYWKVRREE
jgi:toxin ParE1/3/4